MTVFLSEKAAFRLRNFLRATGDTDNSQKGVRVGVTDGGCNGYQYSLNLVDQPKPDDLVFEQDKILIYVDPISAPLIEGVLVDFVESLTQSAFVFTNPNATGTCGCGKSFTAGDCPPPAVACS